MVQAVDTMKAPRISQDLLSLDEFQSSAPEWIKRIHETGRPLILTESGRAAAVLLKPEMLDDLSEERQLIGQILEGLHDIKTGKLFEDEEVWQEVDEIIARSEQTHAHPLE